MQGVSNRLAAARHYIRDYGWAVLMLEDGKKEPATKHGVKDATKDAALLEQVWLTAFEGEDYNVGIATGKASGGLLVVDCDKKPEQGLDGWEWLLDWQTEHGKLPETACVTTGSGGVHLYFKNTTERVIKNSANGAIGVDIRSDGGYVMAPPSIHPNGNTVFWDLTPEETGIAEVNDTVLELIDEIQGGAGVYDDCFEMPDVIGQGERNDVLYRYACSMRAKDVDPVAAWQQLQDANAKHCKPPIKDEVELRKLFQSAFSKRAGLSDEAKAAQANARKRKKGGFAHDVVAQALVDNSGACMIDGKTPAVYDKNTMTYKTGWNAIDKLIVAEHGGTTINNRREVQGLLKIIAPARPLSPWHLIAFQNGVYDLLTREFRKPTKDDVITNVIPHDYDPQAPEVDTPAYRFIESLAGGDLTVIANLGETIGLCMLHDSSKFPFCPVLLGSGANGKSTYMKVLRWLLGDENCSNLQPKEIARRFQTCRIEGKLANLGDDIAGGYLDADACAIIKRVATGEMLEADIKNAMPYDFTPYVTMVFSANDFPRLADTSAGMMRRLHPIEFTQVFSTANGNKNIHLLEELQTEDNAKAFLRLGIECLQIMCTTHEMTENAASTSIKQDIVTTNSTVLQWVEDLDGGERWIIDKTKTLAYESYTDWCRENGIRQPVSAKTMSHELKNYLGITLTRVGRDNNGKLARFYEKK